MFRGALAKTALGAFCLAGCSLLTDLGGLSAGGEGPGDGAATPPETDASADVAAGDGGHRIPADGARDVTSGAYDFRDDFERGDTVAGLGGNGWQEKTIAFRLDNETAVRQNPGASGGDYRNNIATRPPSESVLDVSVSAEFGFLAAGGGWVQIHARVQTASLATPATLDSYTLFRNMDVGDGRTFVIARQRGGSAWTGLTSFETTTVLDTASTYRLTLRVSGTNPVELRGTVERDTGAAWEELASADVLDSSPARISTAGVTGFGAGNDPTGAFSYARFEAEEL